MKLIPISHQDVDKIWPLASEILAPAVARNDGYELEDVFAALRQSRMQLWLADDGTNVKGAGVTQILTYPRKRTCLLLFIAGVDWDSWRHFLTDIEDWAVRLGCDDFEFIGRRGWLKKGLDDYTADTAVFNKKLRE